MSAKIFLYFNFLEYAEEWIEGLSQTLLLISSKFRQINEIN